ncbi:hypothetical protein Cri9333_1888 [Crinalium epipsammum PCC 9333]|uniref:Uncharacterized protein n=1 Tax=Crinalium epipsammum PCC 9333 TaxID=1173022 RepID=K9VXT3_9CYAN|nr:ribbon-helix-helix protein, CopG family [Crinalium epipsammum]AFZ12771.1 hypothetical protein Cri9333_1888 [Crinalium epipsammum PCC 9333]
MTREKTLRVRLDEKEWEKLQVYADSKGVGMSHIIRDYIRRLPHVMTKNQEEPE